VLRLSLAILAVVALTAALPGRERPRDVKRGVHVLKHASAHDLADLLARRFKDATIQAGPPGTSGLIFVSAPSDVFEEVHRALQRLDRQRQTVAVEVFVVALPEKKPDDKEPDDKDFAGSLAEMVSRLEALEKKGQVASFQRHQLTTLEDQPASLGAGVNKPQVSGVTITRTGLVSRSITYVDEGTQIDVTPQVGTDRVVLLELKVQNRRGYQPRGVPALGTDEKWKAIPATEAIDAVLATRLSVPAGKAVLARDFKVRSKSGEGRTLLVVGARLVEGDRK
jgi:type II secretory pathway component GspD/PulD (secretin)